MADSGPTLDSDGGLALRTRYRSVSPQLEVLYNEDLLIDILMFFDPYAFFLQDLYREPVEDSTRQALLFACLTCKSFVKPALDLLWRYMTSLTPLFKILPTFVKVNDIYMFTGVIQPSHMERFRMYARKIRGLEIQECPENIAGHCIHRLLTMSKIQPFFPALTAVEISAPSDPNAIENYAPLFLIDGNLLSNICLGDINSRNESLISSLLLHLSEKVTILQLKIYGTLSHDIVGFLKSFRRLQCVDLTFRTSSPPITASFLQDLQDLPDLHDLKLTVMKDMDDTPSTITKGTKGLQALTSLSIIGRYTASLQRILQCFPVAPGLKHILCNPERATHASIQGCIAEMCRIGRNVERFTFAVFFIDNPTQVVGPMSAHASTDVLSPFIHCQQVSFLKLLAGVFPNLDESIRYLSENGTWRNMQTLRLEPSRDPADSAASLKSLRVLAQCCPVLIDVTIPIDFALHTASSLHQECQHPRTPYHPLKCLLILPRNIINHTNDPSSSTQQAGLVARFLEHYFPNLVGDKCRLHTHDQGDLKWWIVVKMMMEQLSSIRTEKGST